MTYEKEDVDNDENDFERFVSFGQLRFAATRKRVVLLQILSHTKTAQRNEAKSVSVRVSV